MNDTGGTHASIRVEITRSDHEHGGPGWEFGTCLWSPARNRAGGDRYSLMREPRNGDRVLHFYRNRWPDGRIDTRIAASSRVRRFFSPPNHPQNQARASPASTHRSDPASFVTHGPTHKDMAGFLCAGPSFQWLS